MTTDRCSHICFIWTKMTTFQAQPSDPVLHIYTIWSKLYKDSCMSLLGIPSQTIAINMALAPFCSSNSVCGNLVRLAMVRSGTGVGGWGLAWNKCSSLPKRFEVRALCGPLEFLYTNSLDHVIAQGHCQPVTQKGLLPKLPKHTII